MASQLSAVTRQVGPVAVGLGVLGSLSEAREVVRRSFEVVTYTPREPQRWEEPYQLFLRLLPR